MKIIIGVVVIILLSCIWGCMRIASDVDDEMGYE